MADQTPKTPNTLSLEDAQVMAMLHHRTANFKVGDSIAPPLMLTSTFHLDSGDNPKLVYARDGNPSVQDAEARLALLEGAPSLLFASGMAAYLAVLMAVVKSGDKVLVLSDGYYHVRTLLSEIFSGLGIEMVCCSALEVTTFPLKGIRLAVLESPTNPSLDVVDIAMFCKRAKKAGSITAVDNTICTPLLQHPLALGADIVIASDTKAAGGHSDFILGHVSTKSAELSQKIYQARTLGGGIADPFAAWMLSRSLDTLELRLARMCDNAQVVAEMLNAHQNVQALRYPGLKTDPAYEIANAQMAHPGFLIGVTFVSQCKAEQFIKNSGAILSATSFGGVHTCADRRARWGDDVAEGFLRLSIGCEPRGALLTAIEKALDG